MMIYLVMTRVRSTKVSLARSFLLNVRLRNRSTKINNAEDAFLLPSQTVYKAKSRIIVSQLYSTMQLSLIVFVSAKFLLDQGCDKDRNTEEREGKISPFWHRNDKVISYFITQFTSLISRELCGKFLFDKLSTKVCI